MHECTPAKAFFFFFADAKPGKKKRKEEKKKKDPNPYFSSQERILLSLNDILIIVGFFSSPICSDSFRVENNGSWEMRYLSDHSTLKKKYTQFLWLTNICQYSGVSCFFPFFSSSPSSIDTIQKRIQPHRRRERNFPKRVINFLAPQYENL